jgi:hypothetical protein
MTRKMRTEVSSTMEEDKIQDALKAKNVALTHLVREGVVVWASEIVSICKKRLLWLVEIDGQTYRGIVVISQKTGKVVIANRL